MSRRLRYIIIGAAAIALVGIGGFFIWRYWTNETAKKEAAAQQAQALSPAKLLDNPHKKILFATETRQPPLQRQLYLLDVVTQDTVLLTDTLNKPYSNFLSTTRTWFGIDQTTLYKYELTANGLTTTTVTEVKNAPATDSMLAVSSNGQLISWINGPEEAQQIIVYDSITQTETTIYGTDSNDSFANLAWSPDSSELAFTATSSNQVITITTAGAQVYNPISIPFSQFNYITWIEPNHLAAVLSSTADNTSPFSPKIVVLDRNGTIIENHTPFSKIGIPVLLWPTDASKLLFYDPWTNNFLTYNRFDVLQSVVPSQSTETVLPFGWIDGEDAVLSAESITAIPTTTTNFAPNTNTTPDFNLSAEQWDYYNTATRAILRQFPVDFSTYRFDVTTHGITVTIRFSPDTDKPEKAFIQVLLQLMVVLPDLPSISLHMIVDDAATFSTTDFTPSQAKELVAHFTNQPLDQLFIITTESPYGIVAPKSSAPHHNYLGDLFYADTGEYNPLPLLSLLPSTTATQRYLRTDRFSLRYPLTWQTKDLKELVGEPYQTGDTLLYTTDTTFISPSVWQGFNLTVRQYAIPEFGLKEWLQVNRPDSATEDIAFTLHQPLEGKHIIASQPSTDEYILYANHVVYVITTERHPTLTEEDYTTLQDIIKSFSDHSVFTPN